MIKKLIVWNNPYIAIEYHVEIDLISGKTFYKTNKNDNTAVRGNSTILPEFYECFFLLSKARINNFIPQLSVLKTWKPIYEIEGRGITIDGFQWSIKLFNGAEKEIKGCQCKPKEFDRFIAEIEILLHKDFS